MLRNVLFASLIAFGVAGVAQAQDYGPRMIGGGENAEVVYSAPSRNIVGGGYASISGGGENAQVAYGPRVTTQAQPNMVAEMVGGGENAQVVYHEVTPSTSMFADRPATNQVR